MAKTVIVEVDGKGRVRIPSSMRHELKSRRFTLSVKNGRLLMDPVKPATTVRGKHKGLLKSSIEDVEEAEERFVASNGRTHRIYTGRRVKRRIKQEAERNVAEALLLNEKLRREAPKEWESGKVVMEWRDRRR